MASRLVVDQKKAARRRRLYGPRDWLAWFLAGFSLATIVWVVARIVGMF